MSGEVFAALGVPPLLGRTFTQQEDEESQQVAVLSYGMWRSRFHGDVNVLGNKIILYRKPYTVIGVMPRHFEFPINPGNVSQSELWLPLSLAARGVYRGRRGSWNSRMVGRLKPGITAEQAQSDAERVAQETMRDYPAHMRSLRIHAVVTPLQEDTVAQARPLVLTLLFAVIVVLLIACETWRGFCWCAPSADEERSRCASPGRLRRHITPTGHRGKHGLEYRRWRDRAGTGGWRSASGCKPATADATSRQ